MTRSERRNAEVRAGLTPLAPGERPWAIVVVDAVSPRWSALGNLVAFAGRRQDRRQAPGSRRDRRLLAC